MAYRRKTIVHEFKWIPTKKNTDYILKAFKYKYNLIQGPVRSSKDYTSVPPFVERIKISQESLFIVGAPKIDNAYKIVGQLIINYMGGLAIKEKVDEVDAITFPWKNGQKKVILFVNGYSKNSGELIQGLTIGGAYLTEANLLDKEFVAQVMNRMISSADPFLFMTINPKGPKHWFYTEYRNKWIEEAKTRKNWLNYQQFSMSDNPALTLQQIEDAKAGRDPNSTSYKRDILGLEVDPEGAIYTVSDYNILEQPIDYSKYLRYITIMDPGQSLSATIFLLAAVIFNQTEGRLELHILREYHHINNKVNDIQKKNDLIYIDDYISFIKESITLFNGKHPEQIFYDGTDTTKRDLWNAMKKNRIAQSVPSYVMKDKEEERISLGQSWLYSGKLRVHISCKHTIEDFKNIVADPKAADKGEIRRLDSFNEEGHFDCLDGVDYSMSYYKNLIK